MFRRRRCPGCGFDVEAGDTACPFCVAALEAPPPPAASGGPARRPTRPSGALATALVVGVAAIVLLNMMSAGRRGARPVASPRLAPGDRAVLACKGGDGAYAAFGVEAWSRMARTQSRRDAAEMQRLADAGRIALVADGTPAEVVGSHTMSLRLRFLAGPHTGREGWVRREFVRSAPRRG